MSLRVAIVGFGKIARDQHLPAIEGLAGVELVAVASQQGRPAGLPTYAALEELLEHGPAFDAVALCTPPQGRHLLAAAALEAGKHVLMEKPPGATLGAVAPLTALAEARGLTLFAAWHSRFAPAVAPARALLQQVTIRDVAVEWKEDVRVWHPGQSWLWEPGGLGVFDPGINALSILTAILPAPLHVTAATLEVPANKAAPIAAAVSLSDLRGLPVEATFDFRQTGPQIWDIRCNTDAGELVLSQGGARLTLAGEVLVDEAEAEYPGLYRRFLELVESRASDADVAPLRLVADAFLIGRRRPADAFLD